MGLCLYKIQLLTRENSILTPNVVLPTKCQRTPAGASSLQTSSSVFELQQEGLANCGAASTCVAWRNIARNSRVNHLHLHAQTYGQQRFWPCLLAARKYIDTLKLTGDYFSTTLPGADAAEAVGGSIPLCKRLYVGQAFAAEVKDYIGQFTALQQLSIQWDDGSDSLQAFSSLHQLTQLAFYVVHEFNGHNLATVIKSCPDSVESLLFESWYAKCCLTSLEDHLPHLTRLEVIRGKIELPGNSITCLSKLKSLSLCDSLVYVEGQFLITLLTKLTYLDLTDVTCLEALDSFPAWPGLKILKAHGCGLFNVYTLMHVPNVREIHLSGPYGDVKPGPDQQAHVHVHVDDLMDYSSKVASSIVGLTVFGVLCDETVLEVALSYMAAHCSLQSLCVHLEACARMTTRPVLFPGGAFLTLTSLEISGPYPFSQAVDLQSLLRLTSLDLMFTDLRQEMKSLKLPVNLEVFVFSGCSLFSKSIQHNLRDLSLLTNMALQIGFDGQRSGWSFGQSNSPCLPQLPLGLRHLALAGVSTLWHAPGFDWSGLQGCPNLQHLTLARGHKVCDSPQLEEWIRAASHLYVFDRLPLADDWSTWRNGLNDWLGGRFKRPISEVLDLN